MNDPVVAEVARMIMSLTGAQVRELRERLDSEWGESAGVGAVLPPDLPSKEGGAEAPMSEWPDEYWESQA